MVGGAWSPLDLFSVDTPIIEESGLLPKNRSKRQKEKIDVLSAIA
jgi:hypothetical protein